MNQGNEEMKACFQFLNVADSDAKREKKKIVKIWYNLLDGSVAQWIEQLRPKEKVVRSTRARATRENWAFSFRKRKSPNEKENSIKIKSGTCPDLIFVYDARSIISAASFDRKILSQTQLLEMDQSR